MAVPSICLLKFTLVSICFTLCFGSALTKEYVPVYMWGSSSGSRSSEPISALHKISSSEFKDILTNRLQHKALVVFVEENLSVEDFSWQDALGQGSFPKLQNSVESTEVVTYLPSVHAPTHTLRGWSDEWALASLYPNGLEPDVTSANETLLFISLLDASENEDRPHLLKRHDSFMSDMYEKLLEKHDDILAIYTAQHSSWSDEDMSSRRIRTRRETKEGEDPLNLYNANDTIYLYTESIPTLLIRGQNVTLTVPSSVVEEPGVGESDTQLVAVYPTNPEVRAAFEFIKSSANYWSLNEVNITYGDEVFILTTKGIEAPVGFSYHCSQSVVFQDPASKGDTITSLTFENIQVQPGLEEVEENEVPKFGDAYDCVYFMTVPILSGFFVTIIFALIMGFGICMIMDIKTMDRFDDPKGKTINISGTE